MDPNYRYQKPYYDPFEIFDPPVGMIKRCLKYIKSQAVRLVRDIEEIKNNSPIGDFLLEDYEKRHKRELKRIKEYDLRLSVHERSGSWSIPQRAGGITQEDIGAAKRIDLVNFYAGKLRKSGNRQVGRCPFHEDRTPSFVIYPTNDFHCFSCGANGDVIEFVMRTRHLNFIETIKLLTNKL